jgi:hypothetical protein
MPENFHEMNSKELLKQVKKIIPPLLEKFHKGSSPDPRVPDIIYPNLQSLNISRLSLLSETQWRALPGFTELFRASLGFAELH